jgi:hypothetical protein
MCSPEEVELGNRAGRHDHNGLPECLGASIANSPVEVGIGNVDKELGDTSGAETAREPPVTGEPMDPMTPPFGPEEAGTGESVGNQRTLPQDSSGVAEVRGRWIIRKAREFITWCIAAGYG